MSPHDHDPAVPTASGSPQAAALLPDGGGGDGDDPVPQRTPRQISLLRRRLLREIVEANVLGGLLIVVFNLVFRSDSVGRFVNGRTVPLFVVGSGVGFALTLLVSWRVTQPLLHWLADPAEVQSGARAPQGLKIAVILQPAVQAGLVAVLWFVAAVGYGAVLGLTNRSGGAVTAEAAWLRFVIVFAGTCVGGAATTAILYLRVESTWRPWLPTFFPDDDPTSVPLPPITGLKSRLRLTFALGTVVPLVVVAVTVSLRVRIGLDAVSVSRLVWFFAVAGIVIGGILSVNVRRSIMQPIERLKAAMALVRRGDVDVAVPVDRVDELGRLEAGFNDMVEAVRARQSLEDTLRRQVGSQVAALALDTDSLERRGRLGGEVRQVTALFVDLVSFSAMAEREPPAAIAGKLNMVFGVVVEAVERHRGLVNKFLGDAVLAVFGAPSDDPRHAVHALAAAEEIAARLERLDFDFGIGLSSGEAFSGNVGSEGRYEYTVIGDPVNEASRLQELTRRLARRVLLSGRTAELVRGEGGNRHAAALVPLAPTVLRGRSEPTEVFSLSPQLWRDAAVSTGAGASDPAVPTGAGASDPAVPTGAGASDPAVSADASPNVSSDAAPDFGPDAASAVGSGSESDTGSGLVGAERRTRLGTDVGGTADGVAEGA